MRDLGREWKGREDDTGLSIGRLAYTERQVSERIGFDGHLEVGSGETELSFCLQGKGSTCSGDALAGASTSRASYNGARFQTRKV